MGYEDDPQYAAFKQLLEAPMQDALSLLADRFPVPRFVTTEHEGSQVGEEFLIFILTYFTKWLNVIAKVTKMRVS